MPDRPAAPESSEPGGTFSVSWGRYGGFYWFHRKGTRLSDRRYWRLCLGWVALTYVPVEIDDLMAVYAGWRKPREAAS